MHLAQFAKTKIIYINSRNNDDETHTLRRAGEYFVLNIIWYRVDVNTVERLGTHTATFMLTTYYFFLLFLLFTCNLFIYLYLNI